MARVRTFEAQLIIVELLEHKSIFSAGYTAILHVHAAAEECNIVKLTSSIDKKTGRRKDGRRNTYLAPKLQRPNLGISRFSAIAQVWRGHSFYRAEARRIGSIFVPSLGARRTSQQPDVESPRPPRVLGQKQRPGWAVV